MTPASFSCAQLPSRGVPREVPIRGEMIRLGQLLKLAGVVGGGGDAKAFLAEEPVLVNGEPDNRRGRQLHPGDTVLVAGEELRLTSE
jgi:ribosome-associated protein